MTRLRLTVAAVLAGALLLALALSLAVAGGGDERADARTFTARDGAYTIATPQGWTAVADGPAATVLQRADKRGVVVIRRRAAVGAKLDAVAVRLEQSLRNRLADFRPAGARVATVGGRDRLVYTFVRPRANKVQSIVVAPAGDRAYTLDVVADGDAPDVARELGSMLTSFALQS
ncbi:MAG TPA: hypothetical protein VN213_08725 [Solirubrobacteraceae bacterium]|nr:hypothetical protein [Solirubrobacteraceae bacterium]